MASRLVLEQVNMPSHVPCLFISKATWMATGLALISMCVSYWPDASMHVVVFVEEWITEAPSLGLPSL